LVELVKVLILFLDVASDNVELAQVLAALTASGGG
jgi:hypothetical protein